MTKKANIERRLSELSGRLSQISGRAITLRIRGTHSFTASFDGIDADATSRLLTFFASVAACTVYTDDEIGTFVYIEAGR